LFAEDVRHLANSYDTQQCSFRQALSPEDQTNASME